MNDLLLLFLGRPAGVERWLHLANGEVRARGGANDPLPLPDPAMQVAAIVPGEDVSLHWLELPAGLAPAQASAAARLLAAELSAQPLEELHVAAGPDVEGLRCVALAPAIRMESWIATCRALGRDPDLVLPEPLLLLPSDDAVVRLDTLPLPLFRGLNDAFSIEPELAQTAIGGAKVELIDQATFEAEMPQAIARAPVNLRLGAFAKARQWRIGRRFVRRMILFVAALLLVTAAIQVALILRYTFAADQLDAEAAALARQALPPGSAPVDPVRQLDRRLLEMQGSGTGFGTLATGLFDAMKATPNAELAALLFEGGAMRATVVADTPDTLTGLRSRLEGQGFRVENGAASIVNGRQAIEMIVRGR